MKINKGVLFFIVVITILAPILYIRIEYRYPKSELPTNIYLYNKNTYLYHYNNLTEAEKEVYNEYVNAFLYLDKKVLLKNKLSVNSEYKVYEAIAHDHPDIYYMPKRKCRLSMITKKIDFCEFIYPYTKQEIDKFTSIFEDKINSIVIEANKLNNDYEKIKYVHDIIIDMADYDDNTLTDKTYSSNDYQSIVSILTTGKSVCCGYTKLFQVILNRLNINATSFYDNDFIDNSSYGHIWNAVKLDNKWYYVDVTWDDNDIDKYYYFLNSKDEFYQTHTEINDYLN